MKKLAILALYVAFVANDALAQDLRPAKLDSLFNSAHKIGVFNGNVLIADHGKIVYQKSFGDADASGTSKLDSSYRFNIGSIAKEFNAVGIMMLQEKGKLSLSDKISKYLTDLPKWADSISILNLLQYTSGVPNSKWSDIKGDAANLAFLKTVKKLDFAPGTQYAYNNNNTFLQRQVIEKIAQMPFHVFVETQMLKPLGMSNAIVDPTKNDKNIAISFNNQKVEDSLLPPISGWTSVTIGDFYKWAKAIEKYKLIDPTSTAAIAQGFKVGNQAGLGNALVTGKTLVSHVHDGSARNYQALLVTSAANDRTVLLLTNNMQNNLYAFNRSIQAILANKAYIPIKKSLSNAFNNEIGVMTGEQALAFYNQKRKDSFNEFSFESEDCLNEIGYVLLNKNKATDAILIFKKNTELFPQSGNAWDSLAEAYLKTGDKANALFYYKRAYALDQTNANAKRIIAELGKQN